MDKYIVKAAARGHWYAVLRALAPSLGAALDHQGHHVRCPVHGGKDGFRVFKDAEHFADTGASVCNTCGVMSDGFSTLMWANSWSFSEAINAVGDFLRLGHSQVPRPARAPAAPPPVDPAVQARRYQVRQARMRALWQSCLPLCDPKARPVNLYLSMRGLSWRDARHMLALRAHPALAYYTIENDKPELQGYFPALVALVTDPSGRAVTLHRIYVTEHGGKLPVEDPKKMLPLLPGRHLKGASIKLGVPTRQLGVAEGIETAIAVHMCTRMPVWATLNTYGMKHFDPPANISDVWIWGDKDRQDQGLNAAKLLKQRLWATGCIARIVLPDLPIADGAKGVDWNDQLRILGPGSFIPAAALTPITRVSSVSSRQLSARS